MNANILTKAANMFQGKGQKSTGLFGDGTNIDDTNPPTGAMGKFKHWIGEDIVGAVGRKAQSMQETAENYKLGLMILAGGILVLMLSLVYLPLVAVVPQKFCALFSIGSIIIMVSLSTMLGHSRFLSTLLGRSLLPYTLVYAVSLLLGLYYSCISKSYILALLMIVAEMISLSYLVLVNVPYGKATLDFLYKNIFKGIKNLCSQCLKKNDKPYLPL